HIPSHSLLVNCHEIQQRLSGIAPLQRWRRPVLLDEASHLAYDLIGLPLPAVSMGTSSTHPAQVLHSAKPRTPFSTAMMCFVASALDSSCLLTRIVSSNC